MRDFRTFSECYCDEYRQLEQWYAEHGQSEYWHADSIWHTRRHVNSYGDGNSRVRANDIAAKLNRELMRAVK